VLDQIATAEHVTPVGALPVVVRDPKDEKLLACALHGRADYLVSGDRDLLELDGNLALGMLRILTARDFVEVVGVR